MIVDAHHHVWTVARGDYGWMSPDLPIARDYGLDDLRPLLASPNGAVTATILVQAAATESETDFMLGVARASGGLVRGVVGWVDLAAPDAPARIAARAADPLVRGLRPMLQDIEDTQWIFRPEVAPALDAMAATGLRLDALIKPRHLPVIGDLAKRHRGLRVVVDHGAKPDIAGRSFERWAAHMARLAHETDWCCKLSGLVTEAAPGWGVEDLRPYAAHLLGVFGPNRLMWGSDWPVVNLAGGYAAWREAAEALVPESASAAVFGGTAARFYGL